MNIAIDYDAIKKMAGNLSDYSEQLEDKIKEIKNTVSNISTIWQGDDAKKYVEVLQEKYILGLENLKAIIDEYASYLNIIPEAYEILDDVYSNNSIEV